MGHPISSKETTKTKTETPWEKVRNRGKEDLEGGAENEETESRLQWAGQRS